jgi:hypothetical protein
VLDSDSVGQDFCRASVKKVCCVSAGETRGLDRRNKSLLGVARRKAFQDSIELMRTLALSSRAIEHYCWLARKTHRLPHELIREMAEENVTRVDAIAAAVLNTATLHRDGA